MVKKLYNKKSKEELVNNLNYESFKRITCSFYNYTPIENPEVLRDNIYSYFESLNTQLLVSNVDERVVDFATNKKTDAKALEKIIKTKGNIFHRF